MSKKQKNRIKALILAVVVIACDVCSLFSPSQTETVYAATEGQTSSSDVLNVVLTTNGTVPATMGELSESTYVATNNTAGQQRGTIALDNSSVGGYMHVNIGQTIDMYAPVSDADYTDVIGFSGNYTFKAAGGRGGNITAKDTNVSNYSQYAFGGYGSVITNSFIDYNTGQSITYRKGSNGRDVGISEATNTTYWNNQTNLATLETYMGNVNGLLGGTHSTIYRAYTAISQVGTASYIQVSGDKYIVAGGGAPGVVLFECENGRYNATGRTGIHADHIPDIPNGADGFYNPSAPNMTKRYRDYEGTSNINAGRIAGVTCKNGVRVSSGWGGGVQYEDVFYGWVSNPAAENKGLSEIYPGYSGLASRDGSKFSTAGLNDATYSVSIDTSAMQSQPYLNLTCNAKYITINNPTRLGYTFVGWNCGNGVTCVGRNGNSYTYKVTSSGAMITATWVANNYTITYNGNGADNGTTASQTCRFDTTYTLNANGFTKAGYSFEGWATSPNGDVAYADRASVRNLTTANNGNVTLYAKWKAVEYTIAFDANGGTGTLESVTAHYDEDVTLPDGASNFVKYTLDSANVTGDVLAGNMSPAENARVEENEAEADDTEADDTAKAYASVFLGWALEDGKDLLAPRWKAGETVRNLTEQNGGVITLYAVWDDCPWIQATDLYYTLEQAQSGFITPEEILSHMTASDREDGSPILPGTHDNGTSFTIPDYQPTDFTQFDGDGSCTENLTVVDSAGSVYAKQITVYVVDTTPRPVKPEGTTRFINEYYYNQPYELGGLADDSIWKTDPEYIATIQEAFDNLRNDTPQEVYHFTHEQILEMKEFVSEHGIGNSKESDALSKFYDEFMAPNRVK